MASARETYEDSRTEVIELIERIKTVVEKEQDEVTWGYVGPMAHTADELREIARSLRA